MNIVLVYYLIAGYHAIMRQIYAPRDYYQRVRLILRELKVQVATPHNDWQRFLTFFRACLRLGVLGKERFYYWCLMIWTVWRKPRQLKVGCHTVHLMAGTIIGKFANHILSRDVPCSQRSHRGAKIPTKGYSNTIDDYE